MSAPPDDLAAGGAPPAGPTERHRAAWSTFGLAAALVLAVCVAGSPTLEAPWLQGDEHIFIVDNPEVTGAGLVNDSPWQRLRLIFRFPPREDLYQPIPILTYAIQWALWGDDPGAVRLADVLLHGLNGLLLWWVLRLLLARANPAWTGNRTLSWALAFVWALHPVLTSAYAADMGRTHLLSATFALLALGLHLRSLEPERWYLFVAALLALVAAMLCKAVVGWVLLVAVLEAALLGWKTTLRAPRVYLVGACCALFAGLTYWTSQRAGLVADASAGLFGDPLSRSALAVWIYFRDLVVPLWLSWWHLPDPRTGWAYPLVWVGLLLAAGSAVHAGWAWRRRKQVLVAVGWAWCWALLLPVIGLVGAREAAAVDRYLYQPLMGIMLVLGLVLQRLVSRVRPTPTATRLILGLAGALGAVMVLWDLPHVKMFRSTLRRAARVVSQDPNDPRALEALAAAYDFSINHAIPADDLARIPPGQTQQPYFLGRFIETLHQAAAVENLETFFPGPADRAPFHRRLSYKFHTAGQYEAALEQARLAYGLQPDAYLTWVRLAHAYWGLGRWREAIEAFVRCEERLPDDPDTRAAHYTNFGYLLLFDLDDAARAFPKFQAAVQTGRARRLAYLGLARCEIRVGEGRRGFEIVDQILEQNPQDALAGLVLAEYHLRSGHYGIAKLIYTQLIEAYQQVYVSFDWYYEALRGFQTVCAQTDAWQEAAQRWDDAVQLLPDSRELRSFRVWSVACAGIEDTATWADDLLADDPNNPLACLSHTLQALGAEQVQEAIDWARRARQGEPIPHAREFERAAAALHLMAGSGKLPPEAALVEAVIYLDGGARGRGSSVLKDYVAQHADSPWAGLAQRLAEEASAAPVP